MRDLVRRDLDSVLSALLDGVILLDSRGCAELLNDEACRILEVGAEAASGSTLEELLGAAHPLPPLVRQVLDTGRPAVRNDVQIHRRYESDLQVDVTVSPIFEGHASDGGVVVLRDRTISNSLHERVSQRERLVAYGHIAAGIAHEVKNPLGGIRGAAELLARRVSETRSQNAAKLIVKEVDRITSLVDDLMVFARGDSLEHQRINLHRVLDEMLGLCKLDPLAKKVKTLRLYDPSIPEILGDADRLKQVFLNLTRNALQAMEPGDGTLTIETRMKLGNRLAGGSGRGGVPTVEVIVGDTGPGISPAILDQLETPFFTTKVNGTGLGLAVSRYLVARHGGTLHIESTPGEGTKVLVDLPLDGPEAGEEGRAQ